MNVGEIIAVVRLQAMLEATSVDYPDTTIIRELNRVLTTKFERAILQSNGGYWIQYQDFTVTAGLPTYRIPSRALKLSKVEIGNSTAAASTGFTRLPEVSEDRINTFQMAPSSVSAPQRFVVRGDRIFLDPYPDSGGYTLRMWYYVRPSRLIPLQSAGAGIVQTVNTTTRVVFTTAGFSSYAADGTATPTFSTSQSLDIISGGGWRELQVVGATASIDALGNTITFAVGTDLSRVQSGDAVRVADQTPWPQIPEDFHSCLCDLTSGKILLQRDFQEKAASVMADASTDMERFAALIADRVVEDSRVHRADYLPSLRIGRFWGSTSG